MKPSLTDSDNDLPEEFSLKNTKAEALAVKQAEVLARIQAEEKDKTKRRLRDVKLKSQAAGRRQRLEELSKAALAQLTVPRKEGKRKREKLLLQGDKEDAPVEEFDLNDKDVLMMTSAIETKERELGQNAAKSTATSREQLLMWRNRATRAPASVSLAKRRLGMPALNFEVRDPKKRAMLIKKFTSTKRRPTVKRTYIDTRKANQL